MVRPKGIEEPDGRGGKEYAEAELQGMRVAGQILKEIRLAHPHHKTHRDFMALLKGMGLTTKSQKTLQDAEAAGEPRTDDPDSSYKTAPRQYIALAATTLESVYDADRLLELYRGKLSTAVPLYKAIEARKEALGNALFAKALKAAELTKDDLLSLEFRTLKRKEKDDGIRPGVDAEPRILLTKELRPKLARLLEIPEFMVMESAIAQIQEEIQKRDFPDKPLAFPKSKTVYLEITSEDIVRGVLTVELKLNVAETVQNYQLLNAVELQDNAPVIPSFVLQYMPSIPKSFQLVRLLYTEQAKQNMAGDNRQFAEYIGIPAAIFQGLINGVEVEINYEIYAAIASKVGDDDGSYGNWALFGDLLGVDEDDRHPTEQAGDRPKHATV